MRRGPNWKKNREKRARDMNRAAMRYRALIEVLGGKCKWCGETGENDQLTVDHIDGITWDRRKLRLDARIGRYVREYTEGVRLQVLCHHCNSVDGRARQMAVEQAEEAPF